MQESAPATRISTDLPALSQAGQAANARAAAGAFARYNTLKSKRTIAIHHDNLVTFAAYITPAYGFQVTAGDLQNQPTAWAGITWGMIQEYVNWLVARGFAIATVNLKLSTVKTYAKLAHQAGVIPELEYRMITTVSGFGGKEGVRVDEHRAARDTPIRQSPKKTAPVTLTPVIVKRIKRLPDRTTDQGKRDYLMLCLLFDLGLRVGELVRLELASFDTDREYITVERPKVGKIGEDAQTLALSPDIKTAITDYESIAPQEGRLFWTSRKGGYSVRTEQRMTERAVTARIRYFAEQVGVDGVGAHDCRHFWATNFCQVQRRKYGTVDVFKLQEAGGWRSLAMPRRYVKANEIPNENWDWDGTQTAEQADRVEE